jgi:hypothetical protein
MAPCPDCGLEHAGGETFVDHSDDPMHPVVDTCVLEPAWRAAHSVPMPEGSLAYHATMPELLAAVLALGLDPEKTALDGCPHVCFAPTPELAAGTMKIVRGVDRPQVLEVDVSGLDLFFELGEARHHGDRLEPGRIVRLVEPAPTPAIAGWSDPFRRRQHSDCLARLGYPLDRRALSDAAHEADRRFGYDHTRAQYLEVAVELAAERAVRARGH